MCKIHPSQHAANTALAHCKAAKRSGYDGVYARLTAAASNSLADARRRQKSREHMRVYLWLRSKSSN